jgi:hypothetical protein
LEIIATTIIANKAYDADERMIVPAIVAGMAIIISPKYDLKIKRTY